MGRLENKKILVIVGQTNYDEEELNPVKERLESEGADLFIATNSMQKALGRLEGFVTPDLTIEEAASEDFDAVVIIGGYGASVHLVDDPATHAVVQQAVSKGKVIAAASTAPMVLLRAGILHGKKATVFPDYNATLAFKTHQVQLVHEDVVEDDNIITTNHHRVVDKLIDALIKKLESEDVSEKAG